MSRFSSHGLVFWKVATSSTYSGRIAVILIKTIVKRPKLYFYYTAIVCYLLGICNVTHLRLHPLRGSLFEGMVVTEFVKDRRNARADVNLFYWRDKTGREVDLIVDESGNLFPIEIKSGRTIHPDFFRTAR
jgi:uncharacterized protein